MTDNKAMQCLYVSGFNDGKFACNPGKWDQGSVEKITKIIADMKDNQVVNLPAGWDLDIVKVPMHFPAGNAAVYIQRNRKSGKVRLLVLQPNAYQKYGGDDFLESLYSDENNILLLDSLRKVGDTEISAKLTKNIQDSVETKLRLELLAKQKRLIFE
jgi:hypothetical protein